MSQIPLSSVRSWVDAFRTLKDYAEAQRGKTTAQLGDQVKLTWPRTTGRDVAAIAAVFDNPVRIQAPRSLVDRWSAEVDLLTSEPAETRADTYVGNRSFWMSLVAMAIELDQLHAPLPEVVAWDAAIHELATKSVAVRADGRRKLVTVFDETTWEAMAERQLQFFRQLRATRSTTPPSIWTLHRRPSMAMCWRYRPTGPRSSIASEATRAIPIIGSCMRAGAT